MSIFVYYLRRRFSQNMRFLQNHKDNYGASCKLKNSTSIEQIFCQLQKALLLKMFQAFPKNKTFSWLHHLFILKNPKICMKFYKSSISCFWEKVVLINWLTGWQWCFHKTPFLPTDKVPIISITQLIDMSNVV